MIFEADMATTHFGDDIRAGSCAHYSTFTLFPKPYHLAAGVDRARLAAYAQPEPFALAGSIRGHSALQAMRRIFE